LLGIGFSEGDLSRGGGWPMLERVQYRFERAYYRVWYPLRLRPTLLIGAERFNVVDVSERGLRFVAMSQGPMLGTGVVARLFLPEVDPIEVEGIVVRRDARHAALSLVRGIPFHVILDQQRLLHQRTLV
jgi:PilZ domain